MDIIMIFNISYVVGNLHRWTARYHIDQMPLYFKCHQKPADMYLKAWSSERKK